MSRPATKFVQPLSEADSRFLQQVWREHESYRVRCRAHAVLLSSQGFSVAELQQIFGISEPTALAWIDRWHEAGRDGLEDDPRPGGPPTLNEDELENILKPLLERFPNRPRKVLEVIREQTGKTISRSTLRRMCRRLGFRWKRLRRSERKQRDEEEFRIAIERIEEFRTLPNVELAYFDEAGFSLEGVVPYGWQPIGERAEVPVGAKRARVQVLGIQEENANIYGYLHQGRVNGSTVAEVLDDYSYRITRPTLLILDNASVHTCNLINENMETWSQRGLYLFYIPPHSPELNAIERLWKKIKYQLLPIDCWEYFSSLVDNLVTIFRRNGEAFVMPSLQSQ